MWINIESRNLYHWLLKFGEMAWIRWIKGIIPVLVRVDKSKSIVSRFDIFLWHNMIWILFLYRSVFCYGIFLLEMIWLYVFGWNLGTLNYLKNTFDIFNFLCQNLGSKLLLPWETFSCSWFNPLLVGIGLAEVLFVPS